MPVLQVDNITVDFGGVKALSEVSFAVQAGEIMGLIGPNGAGKTTLMRVITGTVSPTAGHVRLAEKLLDRKAVHERIRAGISLSQQLVRPFRTMSVLDNVTLAAGFAKTKKPLASIFACSKKKERERAKRLLELLGIEMIAEDVPTNLPLGFLKRLEVAKALALQPKVLMLDEPLAGLNQLEARRLADKLLELNALGQTILLIEHNLGEVIRICRRLVVIDNGVKIGEGLPTAVMNDPVVRSAYLGEGSHVAS
jgi:branched-chain amino acid transport system ATP-binding protein